MPESMIWDNFSYTQTNLELLKTQKPIDITIPIVVVNANSTLKFQLGCEKSMSDFEFGFYLNRKLVDLYRKRHIFLYKLLFSI